MNEPFDPALVRDMVLEWIRAIDHDDTLQAWLVALTIRCERLDITTKREYLIRRINASTITIIDEADSKVETVQLAVGDTATLSFGAVRLVT